MNRERGRVRAAAWMMIAVACMESVPARAATFRPPGPRLPLVKVMGILLPESLEVLLSWGFIARLRA